MMKNCVIIILSIMVALFFISCNDQPYLEVFEGDELQLLIDSADEKSTIQLKNAVYSLKEPLYITKPVTIIGAVNKDGSPATVIDYGAIAEHDMNKIPDETDLEPGKRTAWVGGVNIYSGGVVLKNIRIVGDLDWAVAKGPISTSRFFEREESKEKPEYLPIYGLYINPSRESGSNIQTLKDKILVDNVEITRTAGDALLANHIGAKKDWYTKTTGADAVDVSEAKDALVLSNLKIHGNGNIKEIKHGSNGVFLRNSTNITLKDSYIDTGENGAPIWIHSSEYRGPYTIENMTLKGKYKDAEDNAFCFKNNDDAGAFSLLEAPVVIEVNNPLVDDATISYLFNKEKSGDPLNFVDYNIDKDTVVPMDISVRKPYWGNTVIIAITR